MTPIRAVLYAAKSTEDKRGSIATQLADCQAMADHEGWDVIGEYQDEKKSGSEELIRRIPYSSA